LKPLRGGEQVSLALEAAIGKLVSDRES